MDYNKYMYETLRFVEKEIEKHGNINFSEEFKKAYKKVVEKEIAPEEAISTEEINGTN